MKLSQEDAGCWMKGVGLMFFVTGIVSLFSGGEVDLGFSMLCIFGGALWFYLFRKL